MRRAAWSVVLCLLAAGCQGRPDAGVEAIDTGTLVLQLLNSERIPLPSVAVRVDGGPPELTNRSGFVTFVALTPGDHVWSAQADGFIPVERRFSVAGNEVAWVQAMLVPLSAPTEINYYLGEVDCTNEDPERSCAPPRTTLDGLSANPAPGGFRNATLLLEWSGGGEYGFRFEARRNGSALPFADRQFNRTFSGTSPLRHEIGPEAVSPPLRLGGLAFVVHVDERSGDARPTHIQVMLAVHSETGANGSFPPLSLFGESSLNASSTQERVWTFDPGGSELVIAQAVLERDCPVGSHSALWLSFTDASGAGTGRRAQTGPDGDYRCNVEFGVPPSMERTAELGTQYLWGNATWDVALSGDCTCRVHVAVLTGMLPR